MLMFAEFIKEQKCLNLTQIDSSDDIILFLDSRKRNKDPDQKWITTWNDYLWRIKIFYRWYYNTKILKNNVFDSRNWTTPDFINIPKFTTARELLVDKLSIKLFKNNKNKNRIVELTLGDKICIVKPSSNLVCETIVRGYYDLKAKYNYNDRLNIETMPIQLPNNLLLL